MNDCIPSKDNDMKIADFVGKRSRKNDFSDDWEQKYLLHKSKGDLLKTAKIGQQLAGRIINGGEEGLPAAGDHCGALLQRQLLFCFAVETALDQTLSDQILSQSAQNEFYSTIQKSSPQFYRYLNDSGVYSFYLLAYRRGGNVEHSIGKVFAMLNDMEEDGRMSEVGEALYCSFVNLVAEFVESFGFHRPSAE